MDKKRVAKEWLIFIGSAAFAFTLVPALLFFLIKPKETFGKFYAVVFGSVFEEPQVLIVLLSPYILVQLVRLTIWAIKQVRLRE